LSDPEKRKRYDELGPNWQAGSEFTPPPGWEGRGRAEYQDFGDMFGGTGGQRDFSDFFETLFGRAAGGRGGAAFRRQGETMKADIPLTLEEAHRGVTRRITIETPDGPKSLDAKIPAGVRDGSIIRLAGQGGPGVNGGPPGDLRLHVRLQPHPLFRVTEGGDLEIEFPVAPWEAALGAEAPVPTLDGRVEMTIPAGTQGGQRLRLRGQGLNRRTGGRSDLYVKIKIVIPTKLTSTEKELFQRLAAESRFDPRSLLPLG